MTQQVDQQPSERAPRGGLGRLLASTGISITGQGMVSAAVPLLAASLTRNPVGVSVVAAMSYAAWLVVGLPAGALVDRWPRRLTMVLADAVRVLLLAALALATATRHLPIAGLAVLVLLVAVAGCFFDPAAQSAIPQLVGRDPENLATANSRLWTLDVLGRSLIGPPLGAFLFAVSAAVPFGVNALTFALSSALLIGLPALSQPEPTSALPSLRSAIGEGVAYLVRHRGLRALTIGMGTYNLGYNVAFAPLVLFAQDRLHLSDTGFGVLLATLAVGGIAGGWLAPRLHASPLKVYAGAFLAQALAWLVLVTSANAYAAGACLVLVGAASTTVSVVGGTARQLLTPDGLLGRITAGTRVVGIGAAALGSILGGVLAGGLGLSAPFYCTALLLGLAAAFTVASLRPTPAL